MQETDFIALYRGQTVSGARVIALSADPEIVARFIGELRGRTSERKDNEPEPLHVVPGGEATDR